MKLYEALGLPDTIKLILDNNRVDILNYCKENKPLLIRADYSDLKTNILITFETRLDYGSYIEYKKIIKSNYMLAPITVGKPANFNPELIIKSLGHELLHCYELYQTKTEISSVWNKTDAINRIKTNSTDGTILYITDLFYLSLPTEVRARIAAVNLQLVKSKDKLNTLKQTKEWEYMMALINFNPELVYNNLVKIYKNNVDMLLAVINTFTYELQLQQINNLVELKNWLIRLGKYFKYIAGYYKKKMLKLTVTNETITYEKINSYETYLLKAEKKLLKDFPLDYKTFFENF